MNALTIQKTLLDCGDARVVVASDREHRSMLGLSRDDGAVFVQIDRVTMLELERGTVDTHTVMADRCAGVVINS